MNCEEKGNLIRLHETLIYICLFIIFFAVIFSFFVLDVSIIAGIVSVALLAFLHFLCVLGLKRNIKMAIVLSYLLAIALLPAFPAGTMMGGTC